MTTDNILRHGAEMNEKLILRESELVKILNISASTIRRKIKAGTFPLYIKLGPKAKGWRTSDIETWLKNLNSWAPPYPSSDPYGIVFARLMLYGVTSKDIVRWWSYIHDPPMDHTQYGSPPFSSQKVQADSGEPMLIIVWVITIAFFSCFFPIYWWLRIVFHFYTLSPILDYIIP